MCFKRCLYAEKQKTSKGIAPHNGGAKIRQTSLTSTKLNLVGCTTPWPFGGYLSVSRSPASKFALCFFVARWLILKDKGFRLVEATALRPCRGGGVHFVFLAFACWMLTTGHLQVGESVCQIRCFEKRPCSTLYISVGWETM